MNYFLRMASQKNNEAQALYTQHACERCRALTTPWTARLAALAESDILRCSHYQGGRYENIYLAPDSLPGMQTILDVAATEASRLLARPVTALRVGWWLNRMAPGDVTFAHTHDEDDELLSGVYYIDVPPRSGELVLIEGARREVIAPQPGLFVFFAPDVLHEVTRNDSDQTRFSIGFNIGLQP